MLASILSCHFSVKSEMPFNAHCKSMWRCETMFYPLPCSRPVLLFLSKCFSWMVFLLLILQVELEIAIDTMSPNYCRSKGEQIALNVDGTGYDETNTYSTYVLINFKRLLFIYVSLLVWVVFFCLLFFNRKMMDKQTFSSIQATTNTSRYAAAVFRKGPIWCIKLMFWFVWPDPVNTQRSLRVQSFIF